MVPRVPLLMRLWRSNTALSIVTCLVQVAGGRVDGAALALGDCAVVAGSGAVFDCAARELGGYRLVDATVDNW
jgi:hypothetical protein